MDTVLNRIIAINTRLNGYIYFGNHMNIEESCIRDGIYILNAYKSDSYDNETWRYEYNYLKTRIPIYYQIRNGTRSNVINFR